MAPELTPEAWAQIRHDYEHTERPVAEICAEHGISTGTLRDRVRRWGWTPRRLPIPPEGPPPQRPPSRTAEGAKTPAAPPAVDVSWEAPRPRCDSWEPSPHLPQAASGGLDDRAIVLRLQSAVGRVLPAIEATLPALAGGAQHPREMERAARMLTALTRTLRELNSLLQQRQAAVSAYDEPPRNIDEMRASLARKIEAFIAQEAAADRAAAEDETPAGPPPLTLAPQDDGSGIPTPAAGP